ncbi:Ank3 [Symbiodinium natans]|uniref:Ank3 protein n=1 Tax=Symbiodinium natans TaxID=878477 RepID=A0A812QJL6_9DINO|nr:Ank3 [Symbiodinium natans]
MLAGQRNQQFTLSMRRRSSNYDGHTLKDCEPSFEGKTITESEDQGKPCASRFNVDMVLDIPALAVAFFMALMLARFQFVPKLEDKARQASQALKASASDWAVDEFGCTALHRAADEGNTVEVERLLQSGLDIEAKEAWEETPLHIAARKGHADCVACLLAAGANSEAMDLDDRTPLVLAAEAKQEEVCRMLLDSGAGVAGLPDKDLPPVLNQIFLERLLTPVKET